MKLSIDRKYIQIGIVSFVVIISSIFVALFFINFSLLKKYFDVLLSISSPIIIGFTLAFILNPVLVMCEKFFKKHLFHKLKSEKRIKTFSRTLGILCVIILLFLGMYLLAILILPQIITTIEGIVKNSDTYYANASKWMNDLLDRNPEIASFFNTQLDSILEWMNNFFNESILPQVNEYIQTITSGVFGLFSALKNVFIGIIMAIYVMIYKDILTAQSKKIIYAIFNVGYANRVISITRDANKIFSGFISGKILDSIIIGLICYILMTIFNMPFAVLISVLIGITNIIPFFGPFIGAIPSMILILLVSPITMVYFGIMILALQQFDGNILGPKILGNSTGLNSFWVLVSILIASGLFGIAGMILGVPVFALIYILVKAAVSKKLDQKNLPTETSNYHNLVTISDQKELIHSDIVKIIDNNNTTSEKKET